MVRAHVVDDHIRFERGHRQLVHQDVLPIELHMAHAVLHVRVPPAKKQFNFQAAYCYQRIGINDMYTIQMKEIFHT